MMKYIFILFFLFTACAKDQNSHKRHHTAHTHKLVRPLEVAFLSKNEVFVKVGDLNLHSLTLNVFHQVEGAKNLIFEKEIESKSGSVLLELSEDLEEQGGVLAAVVRGLDSNNKKLSSSASYVLGEQDEINSVKDIILKN